MCVRSCLLRHLPLARASRPQVCHIDSGVRTDHPDLAGRILAGWNLVPEVQVRRRSWRRAAAGLLPPMNDAGGESVAASACAPQVERES